METHKNEKINVVFKFLDKNKVRSSRIMVVPKMYFYRKGKK